MNNDQKIDNILARIEDINITLTKQSGILEEHTKRSLHNEEQVELLAEKFSPVYDQYIVIKFLAKWVGIAAGSGLIYELIRMIYEK